MEKMSDVEMRCFSAVQYWQRKELAQHLKDTFTSFLPHPLSLQGASGTAKTSSAWKLAKVPLIIILFPLLLLIWLARVLFALALCPYRYLSTLPVPQGLHSPGERNIQGIHRAFSPYNDLSPAYYLLCVNDWVTILYGVDAARKHQIETYLFAQSSSRFIRPGEAPSRQHISLARESLSRALGYY